MIINETLKNIKQRRSTRSFKAEQIKEEELQAVLEAGLYAPYAWEQSKHFTVVQNRELQDRLKLAAKETARQMDLVHLKELGSNESFDCLYGAPTLVIVSGNEQAPISVEADCAAAAQNLLIAAESIGLGSCWIFFVLLAFQSSQGSELLKELKIPEGYRPYYTAVIGYKEAVAVSLPDRDTNVITYIR